MTAQKTNNKIKEPFKALMNFAILKNGASNGLNFELYCVEFLHLCLHDEDVLELIRKFCINCKDL